MASQRRPNVTRKRQGKQQQRRRRRAASSAGRFWHSTTGRVAGGIAILTTLAIAVGLLNGPLRTGEDSRSAPGAASMPIADPPTPVRQSGTDTATKPALSFDPAARVPETQAWQKNAVASAAPDGRPMIAVVIDDVGLDRRRSSRAMALPAPVTIALMAYADDARSQAETARRAGHELIVHLPMEPDDVSVDPGPNALLSGLPAAEFQRRLDWNLSRFAGYVGINNHMGSRLTSDPAALATVMVTLKRRGLLFLDSRTSAETQGVAVAQRFGVPAIERNIFIDHDPSPIAVRAALVRAEDIALEKGYAIAIGHPKDATLDALEEWLPELRQRGFAVVPLTAVVRRHVAG